MACNKRHKGFTLAEALISSLLLATALVPTLRALSGVQASSITVEHRTQSLVLARAKINDIRCRAIYNYNASYASNSVVLSGSYLAKVTDTPVSGTLRQIKVVVGFDRNNDKILSDSEIDVQLETLIAKRW